VDIIDNPSLELLEDCILRRGDDYWNVDAGDATLETVTEGSRVVLDLELVASRGFCIVYMHKDVGHFVSLGSDNFHDAVEKAVGGQPRFLPAAVFIPRELAWEVVKEFHATGKRSNAIRWIDRREMNWDPETGRLFE
jgi:hypothetical protein